MRRLQYRVDPLDGSVVIYTQGPPFFRLQLSNEDVTRLQAALRVLKPAPTAQMEGKDARSPH